MLDEAIVLAGGLGSRLRGVVPEAPKPIAPIAGRPFLAWLLDHLERSGVRRVILSVGYRADMIRSTIGTQHGSLSVEYVEESVPLGTGGALRRSLAQIRGAGAFAVNGDTLFLADLLRMGDIAARFPRCLVVALREVENADRYGTCTVQNDLLTGFAAAKPGHRGLINGGIYVLPRGLFDRFDLPVNFSFEKDFMEPFVVELEPRALISDAEFIDIGVPDSYKAAQTLVPAWLTV